MFDCPCQVYRCEFNDLEKWDYFALIALLGPDGNIVTDFRRSRESTEQNVGHFVTLVNYDPSSNMISAIDGSYGEVRQFSKRRFLEMWTGYVLAPDRSQNSGFPLGWVAGNGAFGLAALAWFTIWSARRRAKVRVRSADVVVDPSGGR